MDQALGESTEPTFLTHTQLPQGLKGSSSSAYLAHPSAAVDGHSDVVEHHSYLTPGHPMRSREVKTTDLGNGILEVTGQELLASIGQPGDIGGQATSLPAGGVMLALPVNPRYIDGCRVAKILEMYDQYRFMSIDFEYHPVVSAFTPGQLVMGYVNDVNDALTSDTGFQAVRDLYTRAGSIMFNVAAGAVAHFGHPLLKWYYTANQVLPELEMPGMLVVQTTQPLNAPAGSSAVSYGLVTMSYRIQVRAPSIEEPSPSIFSTTSLTLNMTNATGNTGNIVAMPSASFPAFFAGLNNLGDGAVFIATIAAVDDSGPGSAVWRTWRDGRGAVRVLSPGNILYIRICRDGSGNVRALFTPTLSAAMTIDSVSVGNAYTSTANQPATLRGFKLWNITGFDTARE